jgi:hypothetical protein
MLGCIIATYRCFLTTWYFSGIRVSYLAGRPSICNDEVRHWWERPRWQYWESFISNALYLKCEGISAVILRKSMVVMKPIQYSRTRDHSMPAVMQVIRPWSWEYSRGKWRSFGPLPRSYSQLALTRYPWIMQTLTGRFLESVVRSSSFCRCWLGWDTSYNEKRKHHQ